MRPQTKFIIKEPMKEAIQLVVDMSAGQPIPTANSALNSFQDSVQSSDPGIVPQPAAEVVCVAETGHSPGDPGLSVMLNPDVLKGDVFLVFKRGELTGGYAGMCALLGFKDRTAAEAAFVTQCGANSMAFGASISLDEYKTLVNLRQGMAVSAMYRSLNKIGLRKAAPLEVAPALRDEPFAPVKMEWMGLPLVIECPAGQTRHGVDKDGLPWATWMSHSYGYIENTVSMERGDQLDIFLHEEEAPFDVVYIIDLQDESGGMNEEKVFLGFQSTKAAKAAFLAVYPEEKLGVCYAMTMEDFQAYLAMRLDAVNKQGLLEEPSEGLDEEDPLDYKSLTRNMLRSMRELKSYGIQIGKESIAGNIAKLKFSTPGLGSGTVVGSPMAKDVFVVEMSGTGQTAGSVYAKASSPAEALVEVMGLVKTLQSKGLWNSGKHNPTNTFLLFLSPVQGHLSNR